MYTNIHAYICVCGCVCIRASIKTKWKAAMQQTILHGMRRLVDASAKRKFTAFHRSTKKI